MVHGCSACRSDPGIPTCEVAPALTSRGRHAYFAPCALRPRLPLPLGPRVVPHVRGVPGAPRRRGRPRARSARGRSRLPLPARRADDPARGLPGDPARAARRRSRAAIARGPARRRARGTCSPTRCCRPARRTCATCSPARRRGRARPGVAHRLRARLLRPSGAASAALRRLRHRPLRPLARQRRTRSTTSARRTAGSRPTAAPCAPRCCATATSTPPACPRIRTRRRADSPSVARRLDDGGDRPVLLMNGFDHMLPDAHIGAVAEALARRTGAAVDARSARRRARTGTRHALPAVRGELLGARLANLLPGVWSTRTRRSSSRNRALRAPARGLGRAVGGARPPPRRAPDERPALRVAWRACCKTRRTTRSAAARSTR